MSFAKRSKDFKGFLVAASVKEKTYKRYAKEVSFFVKYISNRGVQVSSMETLDNLLQEYMEEVYILNSGRGKSLVANALNGVKLFIPKARGSLPASEKAYKGFDRLSPSKAYPPMSRGLAYLVAYWLLENGFREEGIMVIVGYECFLRISEATSLKVGDIGFRGDSLLGKDFKGLALVRIGKAKTGANQSAIVEDPFVAKLLQRVVKNKGRGSKLYGSSSSVLRKRFGQALQGLNIQSVRFVFHSLRHGRATEEDIKGTPLEDILRKGRWAAAKSGRHYIQSGRALLLSYDVNHLEEASKTILKNPSNILFPLLK